MTDLEAKAFLPVMEKICEKILNSGREGIIKFLNDAGIFDGEELVEELRD